MAMIPLNQKVYISKFAGRDSWNKPIYGPQIEFDCRFVESSEKIIDNFGNEVVTGAKIYIEDLQDITESDLITFTNEINKTISKNPIRIKILRDFSGIPLFTVVYLK